MNPAVLTQKAWDRASAYFRHYLASPPSAAQAAAYEEADRAGVARPIVFDHRRHDQAVRGALTELRTRWGHEQAAVAAEASGSSVAGGAEEPLLSDNVAEGSQPDVAGVPLPSMSKRMRAEVSEKTVGDPLEWHCIGKRQKTESSLMEESSQNIAMQFGSPAKGRYVCPHGAECEDFDCPCKDVGLLWQQARKVGKGKGRSGGRAAPKKDRNANTKEKGKEALDWLPLRCSGAYLRWIPQKARQFLRNKLLHQNYWFVVN